MKYLFFVFLVTISSNSFAEDFPFDPSSEKEFRKGFGENQGISLEDKDDSESDRAKIGGTAWSELQYSRINSDDNRNYLFNPNYLWVYLDSRLRGDTRGYIKGKLTFDPTIGITGRSSPITGTTTSRTTTGLEEFKLLFNVNKKVFFTVGKQKIKWGAAKFWNPTDFMNSEKRDLIYTDDRRGGVSLGKAHIPVGASNFYVITSFDDAKTIEDVGGAARIEVPIGTSEFSISASGRRGRKALFGADFSAGIYDFDVYSELGFSRGSDQPYFNATGTYFRENESVYNSASGISYEYKYSDSDTISFGLEYFYNDSGYNNRNDYVFVLENNAYTPYFLSKHYGMFLISLPAPGNLNYWSFSLMNFVNLTDRSAITRLATTVTAIQDLRCEFAVGYHYGDTKGEFKMGNQLVDSSLLVRIDF